MNKYHIVFESERTPTSITGRMNVRAKSSSLEYEEKKEYHIHNMTYCKTR